MTSRCRTPRSWACWSASASRAPHQAMARANGLRATALDGPGCCLRLVARARGGRRSPPVPPPCGPAARRGRRAPAPASPGRGTACRAGAGRSRVDPVGVDRDDVRVLEPGQGLRLARPPTRHLQRHRAVGELRAPWRGRPCANAPRPSSSTRWNPAIVCPASGIATPGPAGRRSSPSTSNAPSRRGRGSPGRGPRRPPRRGSGRSSRPGWGPARPPRGGRIPRRSGRRPRRRAGRDGGPRQSSTRAGSPASQRRARSARRRASRAPGRACGSRGRYSPGSGRSPPRQAASYRRARPTAAGEEASSQVRPGAIVAIGSALRLGRARPAPGPAGGGPR